MKLRRLLVVLCFTSLAARAQTVESGARNALNRGIQALRSGDSKGALEFLKQAQQMDPSLSEAEFYIGNAYASQYVPGNTSPQNQDIGMRAINTFEGYLSKVPGSAEGWRALGFMYQNTQDYQRARSAYRRLTETAPQNPEGFYSLGAVDWILLTTKVNPGLPLDRPLLIAEGLENLDRAIALNPRHTEALLSKSLLLREKAKSVSDPDEALKLIKESDTWLYKSIESRGVQPAAAGAK
jgi:tetratricopeptide (TPR) repeat protein